MDRNESGQSFWKTSDTPHSGGESLSDCLYCKRDKNLSPGCLDLLGYVRVSIRDSVMRQKLQGW